VNLAGFTPVVTPPTVAPQVPAGPVVDNATSEAPAPPTAEQAGTQGGFGPVASGPPVAAASPQFQSQGTESAPAMSAAGAAGLPAAAPPTPSAQTSAPMVPPGEPVAYDGFGVPCITRQVDVDTGRVRHIVMNEDGTLRAFGESTMTSLVESTEEAARRWVDDLSHRELRGLVHELGQRLLLGSRLYECRQAELKRLADAADCAFFGVTPDADIKDIDNAYRKLARKMHPDKNGGTEEAKERFQAMKARYEALKERRGCGPDGAGSQKQSGSDEDDGAEDEGQGGGQNRSEEEEDERTIAYDPTNRNSLDKAVWRMLAQFKTVHHGLEDLAQRLRSAGIR